MHIHDNTSLLRVNINVILFWPQGSK